MEAPQQTLVNLRIADDVVYQYVQAKTKTTPDISVIIPVRNRVSDLGNAVRSVLEQRDVQLELLIVDDASDDGTSAYISGLTDPRICKIGLPQPRGANVARNLGLAFARAEMVAFLDSDDVYLPGRLSKPMRELANDDTVGIVISGFKTMKNGRTRQVEPLAGTYTGRQLQGLVAQYIVPPGTSGLTVRRNAALACQGFDPTVRRMQDRDFVLRLTGLTGGVVLSDVLWKKHWSLDGISSPIDTYYENFCKLVEKHELFNTYELDTRNYLVFRHMLQLAKRGRWEQLRRVWRHAHSELDPKLPSLLHMVGLYRRIKAQRKRMKSLEIE